MAKPEQVTDWAIAPGALKLATDSNRWNLGWQTLPDNLPTDIGEKPNLQQQNYWQNAVHTWLTYFSSIIPDTAGEDSLEDLWEWDTGAVKDGSVDPFCNTIYQSAGSLRWSYTSAAETTMVGLLPDCLVGARYQELLYYLSAGLSLEVIDGAGDKWRITPTGVGLISDALSMSGSSLLIGENIFEIDPTDPSISLTLDESGAISTPSDFSTFVSLVNEASFVSNNPNGIRIALFGSLAITAVTTTASGTSKIVTGLPVKRTWIRPLNNTSVAGSDKTILAAWDVSFALKLTYGGVYRCYQLVNFDPAIAEASWITGVQTDGGTTTSYVSSRNSIAAKTFQTEFSFVNMFPPSALLGIAINGGIGGILDRTGATQDYDTVYGAGKFIDNWIRIEEDV